MFEIVSSIFDIPKINHLGFVSGVEAFLAAIEEQARRNDDHDHEAMDQD